MNPRVSKADELTTLTREAELKAYDLLDSGTLPTLERLVDLAALVADASFAEINVVTTTHTVHLASSARDQTPVPVEWSICPVVIRLTDVLQVVDDASQHPEFSSSPYVNGELASVTSYAGTPLRSRSGIPIGTLCVFDNFVREFTERQRQQLVMLGRVVEQFLELRRSQADFSRLVSSLSDGTRELLHSNASLEAFAAQIGHDVQGPLASIQSALEMLNDMSAVADDPDATFLVQRAQSGTKRASRTVADVMAFAVLAGDRPAERVDLTTAAHEAVEDLAANLGDAEVTIDEMPMAMGYPTEARVILQNLISNAIKHTRSAGIRPRVRVFADLRGPLLRVSVADNGPGIAEADRPGVFNLGNRGATRADGHGIGLSTVARLLDYRGHDYGVSDSPLGGALLWFHLPAAE